MASAVLALGAAGCGTKVQNPVTGKVERTVMDEQAELSEGAKAHQEILKEYTPYNNPALQRYVSEVGMRLAKASQRPNLPWTFTVLDSPEVNAFALPGGYVYITRGIMAHLDSEAELAGVLGHEIGHVTARHSAQRATRQQTAGLGVLAATVLGAVLESKGVGGLGQVANQAAQGVAAGYVARYSREQELQADQLGADYLVRNRYDPTNMVDVIQVLQNQELFAADVARSEGRAAPQGGGGWLASHPSSQQRLDEIRRTAQQLAGSQQRFDEDGRNRYLQMMSGVTYGEGREQGVTRGRNFYHEDLGIALTAPQGWRIQNTPEAITVVNGASDAGLILTLVPPQAGNDHEAILRNYVKAVDGRTERRSLNGLPATHFAGNIQTSQGTAQSRITLVTGPNNRTYVLRYAGKDANAMQRALAGLQEAEASLRPLASADRAQARPYVLRTVPMPAGGFAELARRSPLYTLPEQQLRLLNGAYGNNPGPRPGQPVKIVE